MRSSLTLGAFAAAVLSSLEATAAALPQDVSPANISARQTMTLMGGFAATCKAYTLNDHYHTLFYATCRTMSGEWKISYIDLNLCLANSCGRLVSAWRGSYTASCASLYCQLINTRYQCSCRGCSNNDVFSIIDLNDVVGNDNGDLVCHGLKALG